MYQSKYYLLLVSFLLGMMMLSCNGSKNKKSEISEGKEKTKEIEKTDSSFIYSELIVQMKGDVNELIAGFRKYELETIKPINRRMGIWLLTYNMDKVAPKQMLKELKEIPYVLEAQFNKNLVERE